MTFTEKRILYTLNRNPKWRFSNGGSSWWSFGELAKDINRPKSEVIKAVHSMEEKGILKYQWLVDVEGYMHGSGYLLTIKWDNL